MQIDKTLTVRDMTLRLYCIGPKNTHRKKASFIMVFEILVAAQEGGKPRTLASLVLRLPNRGIERC
jgi:hypothetical protein